MQNGTAAVENTLTVPQKIKHRREKKKKKKIKHRITIQSSSSTPRYIGIYHDK